MNRSLFTSWYAAAGAAIVVGFTLWLVLAGAKPGPGEGSNPVFLLASGWTALGLMLLVTLYSLRKYVHKPGISPETRNPPPIQNLERAESRLNELRQSIRKGVVQTRAEVVEIANRILREEKVAKISRIEVSEGRPGVSPFVIEVFPTEPLGRVAKWLHLHVYLGLAAGALVALHGGGSGESWIGASMNWLTGIVTATGIVGTFLFALGPSWMTAAEKDLSFEEAFVIERSLAGKIDAARKNADASSPAAQQDLAVLEGQRARIRENLVGLARLRFWINIWRVLHIPASILLLALAVVHAFSIWRY